MLLIEPVGYPRKCSAVRHREVKRTAEHSVLLSPCGPYRLAPKARTDIDSVVPEDLRTRLGNAIGAADDAQRWRTDGARHHPSAAGTPSELVERGRMVPGPIRPPSI